jgi:farnesyl diphosphate synthase
MDNSILRRGKPCWHLVPSIGVSNAVNDGLFLENAVFAIIRNLVPKEKRLVVLELINETVMRTLVGQNLDVNTHGVHDFHEDRYRTIIKSKTSFYSFWLPVALGVALSSVEVSEEELHLTRAACVVLGEYFQIQDDYLDCFGSPEVLGKVGTDIEEGKCTWLVVKAFQRATPEQKAKLTCYFEKEHRTKDEVADIKKMYKDLGLEELFESEEKAMSERAQQAIAAVQTPGLRHTLQLLFTRIHKRSK